MRNAVTPKMRVEKVKKTSKLSLFILLLVIIGIVGVIILAIMFIYPRLVPQSNLAEHLPAETTVGYVEMDGLNLPVKLAESGGQEKFMTFLTQLMEFEIQPAVEGFGTGKVAYVLLDVEGGEDKPILLIQAKSKGAALSYFKSLRLEDEDLEESDDANAIYSFTQGQPYSFKFMDRYVALTTDETLLKDLVVEPGKALSEDEAYLKTTNSLPRNKWLSGYVDIQKLTLAEGGDLRNMLEPLKFALNNFAFTVSQDEEGFQFNTFLNLNKELLSLTSQNKEEKFNHKLANYLPDENLGLYVGGSDLAEEWQNTLETISNLNPSYAIILEGLLRAQTDKTFGANVDLRNDLYPLFEAEYALMLGRDDTSNEMALVLAHDDKAFVEKKMEKMAQGFQFIASSFDPKISVVTLPDGTESRELVPDDTNLETSTDKVGDYEVSCTEIGQKAAFCYTVTGEVVIMTNTKALLEKSLNPGEASMLADNAAFEKTTNNLSNITDEITFVNFDHLSSYLEANPYMQILKPVTSHFDSASWVKQYFDDGVTSEGYILLK